MTKHLYAAPALVPPSLGLDCEIRRVLIVLPGYPRADGDEGRVGEDGFVYGVLGRFWRLLTSLSYRQFVAVYRDFYANPRAPDYMLARVEALAARGMAKARIVLVAVDASSMSAPLAPRQKNMDVVPVPSFAQLGEHLSKTLQAEDAFDAAILLHHDALGLGLHSIETVLLNALPDRTFVMNGRQRVYRLDRDMRGRLALRRFLAETRLIELALSLVIRPASYFLGRPGDATTKP